MSILKIDKMQRDVLKALNAMHKENVRFTEADFMNKLKQFNREKVARCCESLHPEFISAVTISQHLEITNLQLSHNGFHYTRKLREDLFHRVFSWFSGHIIELLALILSIFALFRTF